MKSFSNPLPAMHIMSYQADMLLDCGHMELDSGTIMERIAA
jgi:hypothetical protein